MINDLRLQPLTVEELVAQDNSVEDSFCYNKGIWWRKIRPFFYQPAFFWQPIKPNTSSPPLHKAFLGYHHVVQDPSQANSTFNILMYKNLDDYSLENLPRKVRRSILKGAENLEVRKITNINHLLSDGYEVYTSFRKRTNWGRDRSDYDAFSLWIRKLYKLQKRILLGIYHRDKLVSYSDLFAVDDFGTFGIIITHSEYFKYNPNDLFYHSFLTVCKNTPAITRADAGPISIKESLDRFKKKFGFKTEAYPTYYWLNPVFKPLIKIFHPKQLNRLTGNIL